MWPRYLISLILLTNGVTSLNLPGSCPRSLNSSQFKSVIPGVTENVIFVPVFEIPMKNLTPTKIPFFLEWNSNNKSQNLIFSLAEGYEIVKIYLHLFYCFRREYIVQNRKKDTWTYHLNDDPLIKDNYDCSSGFDHSIKITTRWSADYSLGVIYGCYDSHNSQFLTSRDIGLFVVVNNFEEKMHMFDKEDPFPIWKKVAMELLKDVDPQLSPLMLNKIDTRYPEESPDTMGFCDLLKCKRKNKNVVIIFIIEVIAVISFLLSYCFSILD